MLCHACRVHVRRDFPYCLRCGTLRRGAAPTSFAAPQLRGVDDPALLVPLTGQVTTLGRGADNDVVLSDGSVSRRHARVVRDGSGFRIEDLDSFNGIAVAGVNLHGGSTRLADGVELSVGDVRMVFEQPRDARIGSRTMVVGTQLTELPAAVPEEEVPEATGPLTARPRRRSGWALKQVPADGGAEPHSVLSNTRTGVYLQLDEREVFLWNAIDGDATVRDLLFAYADRFGELALPRIEAALAAFAGAGLLRGLPGQKDEEETKGWRRFWRAVYRALLKLEVSVPGLDGAVTRLYGGFGWRFFTRTGVTLTWLSVVGGLVAFFGVAQGRQHLLDFGGAGVWGPVTLAAGYISALVVHELAHALAVKSYGRKVRRGGFMIMMGMPFAFVDTSDMWFGSRWSRVVVALSGPISTAALAGWCAVGAAYLPVGPVSATLFHMAFGLYLNTLYNFNPLMPLDGYQALTDALRLPRLREEASAYFRKGLWKDLRAGRRPAARQAGMAAYGLAVIVGTYGFLVLALLAWRSRLGEWLQGRVDAPWDSVIVAVVVGLVAFPVWAAPVRWLIRVVKRRRAEGGRRPARLVDGAAVEGAA
ncbi:FHA domain-containing protein [Streptomyces sp. NPDC056527]|uniref:FHA domain-containing protein n=1 Tax=Streptomyces sp. NPDC056527 TaxID=3345853 RepID=UPI0036A2BB89